MKCFFWGGLNLEGQVVSAPPGERSEILKKVLLGGGGCEFASG